MSEWLKVTNLKGRQGDAGPASNLRIGTVSTGAADASITGSAPNYTLNMTIPNTMIAENLTGDEDLNTVVKPGVYLKSAGGGATLAKNWPLEGAAGYLEVIQPKVNPTVYTMQRWTPLISGSPSQGGVWFRTLYGAGVWKPWQRFLGPGEPGSGDVTGTGSPEGVVAAPVGVYYTDTASTNGARRWYKATGAGATGWQIESGDTGWRDLSAYLVNGAMKGGGTPGSEPIKIRRSGNVVQFIGSFSLPAWTSGQSALSFPRAGFTVTSGGTYMPTGYATPPQVVMSAVGTTHEVRVYTTAASIGSRYQWTWITDDAWPTTLP